MIYKYEGGRTIHMLQSPNSSQGSIENHNFSLDLPMLPVIKWSSSQPGRTEPTLTRKRKKETPLKRRSFLSLTAQLQSPSTRRPERC